MRENFIVESELEGLSLLNYIKRETIESEGVLECYVGRKLILKENLSIDSNFQLSGDD